MEIRIVELLNEIKTLILGKVNERWLTIREVQNIHLYQKVQSVGQSRKVF